MFVILAALHSSPTSPCQMLQQHRQDAPQSMPSLVKGRAAACLLLATRVHSVRMHAYEQSSTWVASCCNRLVLPDPVSPTSSTGSCSFTAAATASCERLAWPVSAYLPACHVNADSAPQTRTAAGDAIGLLGMVGVRLLMIEASLTMHMCVDS